MTTPGNSPETPQYGQPAPEYSAAPAPAPKKSRAKLWILLAVVVLLVCGGVATGVAIFLGKKAKPVAEAVVAAQKTRLVAPETLGGRPKIADPELADIATTLEKDLKKEIPGATSTVAGIYGDPANEDLVMIFGASSGVIDPQKELDDTFKGFSEGGGNITGIAKVPAGDLGGAAQCGAADFDGVPATVCGWADKGSVGVIVWYFKTPDQAKSEFTALRGQIEQKV